MEEEVRMLRAALEKQGDMMLMLAARQALAAESSATTLAEAANGTVPLVMET